MYSSAHLNLSLSLKTAICRETAFPCCTSGLHLSFQHSMSALWKTFSAGMSCYLKGNQTNIIPYSLQVRHKVPQGAAADSRQDSGTGSRLFEVNIWMWRYGRALPRNVSVADAKEMCRKRIQVSRRMGAETLKRRRLAADRPNKSCVCITCDIVVLRYRGTTISYILCKSAHKRLCNLAMQFTPRKSLISSLSWLTTVFGPGDTENAGQMCAHTPV